MTALMPGCNSEDRDSSIMRHPRLFAYALGSWTAHAQVSEQGVCSNPEEARGIVPLQTSYKFGELTALSVTLNLNQSTWASWRTTSPFQLHGHVLINM